MGHRCACVASPGRRRHMIITSCVLAVRSPAGPAAAAWRRSAEYRGCHVHAVAAAALGRVQRLVRSEEHTSELQSLMRISYAVFCLKKKKKNKTINHDDHT